MAGESVLTDGLKIIFKESFKTVSYHFVPIVQIFIMTRAERPSPRLRSENVDGGCPGRGHALQCMWNLLPVVALPQSQSLRQSDSLAQFKRRLKTHLFGLWDHSAL